MCTSLRVVWWQWCKHEHLIIKQQGKFLELQRGTWYAWLADWDLDREIRAMQAYWSYLKGRNFSNLLNLLSFCGQYLALQCSGFLNLFLKSLYKRTNIDSEIESQYKKRSTLTWFPIMTSFKKIIKLCSWVEYHPAILLRCISDSKWWESILLHIEMTCLPKPAVCGLNWRKKKPQQRLA